MSGEGEGGGDRGGGRSGRGRPAGRYSIFVGIAFLGLIVVATLNTLHTDSGGLLGTSGVRGEPVPEFAVPNIRGDLDLDANIAQDDCETSENPCPADHRRAPACRIDPEGAIRVCDYFDRPLVISFWFTDPSGCPPTQDAVDAVARRYRGRVNFLSIAVSGARDDVASVVEDRGWSLPVGWDRDGAVSNLFRVGVCPTVAFVYPGGELRGSRIGADNLSEAKLSADVHMLLAASARRAEASR